MGGESADHEEETPILGSFSSSSSPSSSDHLSIELVKRRGTTWSAVAHIITGVIGAGVLSLAWSVAQLGWIAGPVSMLVLAAITFVSASILSDMYTYPEAGSGHIRCRSYTQAVRLYLGEKSQYASGVCLFVNLYFTSVAYVITSSSSIRHCGLVCGGFESLYMRLNWAIIVAQHPIRVGSIEAPLFFLGLEIHFNCYPHLSKV